MKQLSNLTRIMRRFKSFKCLNDLMFSLAKFVSHKLVNDY